MCTAFAVFLFAGCASAQDRPALNEFTTWFGGQFANKHAFSDTVNGRLYQVENRYTRLIYAGGPLAVRWVFDVVPMTLVGDPWHTKGRQYAYGGGGSPIGAQALPLSRAIPHFRRWLPLFQRPNVQSNSLQLHAQLGDGVQVFSSSRRRSFDIGCKYHHISNANLGNVNHGMDSLMLFAGVSFFR